MLLANAVPECEPLDAPDVTATRFPNRNRAQRENERERASARSVRVFWLPSAWLAIPSGLDGWETAGVAAFFAKGPYGWDVRFCRKSAFIGIEQDRIEADALVFAAGQGSYR